MAPTAILPGPASQVASVRPALFISLELSRSTWRVTALGPGSDKISKYSTPGGNGALLRTLLAWKRGEPRVCAMVVPPTPEQEDRRRTSRERAALVRRGPGT